MKFNSNIEQTDVNRSFKELISGFSLIFILSTLFIFTSCDSTPSQESSIEETDASSNDVHIAFAGGGWRAHTGHSAWTISLLDNGNKKLEDAFSNVQTIASNSGGSWFSSMLLFSESFVNDIEAQNASTNWSTNGWTGKQRNDFNNSGCSHLLGDDVYLECVFDKYTGIPITGGTHWKLMVENLVFKDYSLGKTTLDGIRQPWAENKSWLLASTLLKDAVVLNKIDWELDHRYYQACLSPKTPDLNGHKGSNCGSGFQSSVTSVTFSSLPAGSTLKHAHFLAALGANPESSELNLGYTKDFIISSHSPTLHESVKLPLHHHSVPIMTAASASSAALGYGASARLTKSFEISSRLDKDALSFSLSDSNVEYVDANSLDLDKLASEKVVRLADGGAMDNSAVAQLVSFLQLNDNAENFNIVAFDNVQTVYNPTKGGAPIGVDIASLFGYREDFCVKKFGLDFCLDVPDVQVFDKEAMESTGHTWSSPLEDGKQLIYTKYTVQTKENPVMGVKAGNTGTLHSFTCLYPDAATAPTKGDADFDTYDDMFTFINSELVNNGGLPHLQAALGL